jgi:hypothetical protein
LVLWFGKVRENVLLREGSRRAISAGTRSNTGTADGQTSACRLPDRQGFARWIACSGREVSPTWQAFDQKLFNVEMPEHVTKQGQERAYTSPIWYTP